MKYLIWSIEHKAWWRPNSFGYTRTLSEAGRYEEEKARLIVNRANTIETCECLIPESCVQGTVAQLVEQ